MFHSALQNRRLTLKADYMILSWKHIAATQWSCFILRDLKIFREIWAGRSCRKYGAALYTKIKFSPNNSFLCAMKKRLAQSNLASTLPVLNRLPSLWKFLSAGVYSLRYFSRSSWSLLLPCYWCERKSVAALLTMHSRLNSTDCETSATQYKINMRRQATGRFCQQSRNKNSNGLIKSYCVYIKIKTRLTFIRKRNPYTQTNLLT